MRAAYGIQVDSLEDPVSLTITVTYPSALTIALG